MATGDLRYKVSIDTANAQRSLGNLSSTISRFGAAIAGAFAFREFATTSARIDDLRRTLQTLYKDTALGAGAFQDTMKLANQLGVDVDVLAQSVIKLKSAGLDPSIARLTLFSDVAKSSTDAIGVLTSVTDLFTRTMAGGLGVEELDRLQERGVPVFDILSDKLKKNRTQLSEFGKSAAGAEIIRTELMAGLQELYGGASERSANSLSSAMARFRNALKEASDTLATSGIAEHLVTIANATANFVKENKELIAQFGKGFADAFQFFLDNIGLITKAAGIFLIVFSAKKILDIMVAFKTLNAVIGKSPMLIIAAGAVAAASALGVFDGLLDDLAKAFGIAGDEADKMTKSLDESKTSVEGAAQGFKVFRQGETAKGVENLQEKLDGVNESLRIFRAEMANTVKSFALYNEQQRDAIKLETSLIGATAEQIAIRQAQADISRKAADEIANLRAEQAKLTKEQKDEGRSEIIEATIKKIEAQAEADKALTEESVKNSQARLRARQLELFEIQNRISFEDKLMDIQKEMAQVSMTEIEKKYDDIRRAADASALAAIRAEEARIGRRLNTDEQKKYYEEAKRYTEILTEQQKKLYEESRRFETGWTKAFKEYADEATNAAKQAERIFQKTTQGMEDAIVNFAKTGKFEFKGFLNSILEELLRSQIRQLMAQVFNIGGSRGSGGGGGLFGSVGKLLGFANGGIIPTNAPVLVGERGPELISGAAGRNVTPNEQLGLGTTNVIYNISAVDARSFKELVASDPSFIYAVTEQGRRTIPSSRR